MCDNEDTEAQGKMKALEDMSLGELKKVNRGIEIREVEIRGMEEEKVREVFIDRLRWNGSVGIACEALGISRGRANRMMREDEKVKEAVRECNEVAFEGLLSWLHDHGNGVERAGQFQVETQWKLFYFRHKHILNQQATDGQTIINDNRRMIVNLIGDPTAREALDTLARLMEGKPGSDGSALQSGVMAADKTPQLSE